MKNPKLCTIKEKNSYMMQTWQDGYIALILVTGKKCHAFCTLGSMFERFYTEKK